MGLQWNGDSILVEIEQATAPRLLAMAVLFQTEFMHRLNRFNPPPYNTPSVDGEYLKKRTGNLQGGIQIDPTDPNKIKTQKFVRVAYSANVYYGAIWEISGRRKGMRDCLKEIENQLAKVATQ